MPHSVLPIAYPLDDFYAQAGRALPPIEAVAGDDVPEPYKSLLVHQDDMTPTLEKFHGERIHLAVLSRQQRDDFYFREVVLLLDKSDKPVEFGAIKINLALFPPAARKEILEERRPLGTLLADYTIVHGRVLVRRGQLTMVDLPPLVERHNRLALALAQTT